MSFLFVDSDCCPFCHRPANGRFGLCRDCLEELESPGACRLLESDLPDEKSAISVDADVPFYVYSALFYNRFLRHFFGAYKFHQQTSYERVFQSIVAAYAQQHPMLSRASWVSYIPQSHRREVLRGSHPARALAEAVASALKLPLLPLLQKGHTRVSQKRISAWERFTNVKGAFSVSPSVWSVPPRGVGIVCDDFVTTGNTLREALEILDQSHLYAVGLALACVDFPSSEETEGGWLQREEKR